MTLRSTLTVAVVGAGLIASSLATAPAATAATAPTYGPTRIYSDEGRLLSASGTASGAIVTVTPSWLTNPGNGPKRPTMAKPRKPLRANYRTIREYRAAVARYNKALARYNRLWHNYRVAYNAWLKKRRAYNAQRFTYQQIGNVYININTDPNYPDVHPVFRIRNYTTGLCLTSGTPVRMIRCDGRNTQRWAYAAVRKYERGRWVEKYRKLVPLNAKAYRLSYTSGRTATVEKSTTARRQQWNGIA